MDEFLKPWPVHPLCGGCQKQASTSHFDPGIHKTVVRHVDGSPPCLVDGGNPFVRHADHSVGFAIKTLPDFTDLTEAEKWAELVVAAGKLPAIRLGYVYAQDGHRSIGRVESEADAIVVVEETSDGVRRRDLQSG